MPPAMSAPRAGGGQSSFQSSPWEDSAWEIVGDAPRGEEFYPMQVSRVASAETSIDPMFADFGGTSAASTDALRWHLPEHLASKARASRAADDDNGKVKLAVEEIERIKAEAFAAGEAAGRAAASADEVERMRSSQSGIAQVLQDLRAQLDETALMTAQRATEIAVAIAKKVIDGAVDINPEYIVSILKQALPLAGGAVIQNVRVSPQDMEFIEVVGAQRLLEAFDGSWSFEADPSIRAGCIVNTSAGEIDFDLDRAFERVRDNVIKVVR